MIFVDTHMREYKIVYKLGSERRSMSAELEEVSQDIILSVVLDEARDNGQNPDEDNIEILAVFRI